MIQLILLKFPSRFFPLAERLVKLGTEQVKLGNVVKSSQMSFPDYFFSCDYSYNNVYQMQITWNI